MPIEKTEVAEGLDKDTLAWLDDSEKSLDETEKKIASGEIPRENIAGWDSENWQAKANAGAPPDIDV